jgi:hypothetical protein
MLNKKIIKKLFIILEDLAKLNKKKTIKDSASTSAKKKTKKRK